VKGRREVKWKERESTLTRQRRGRARGASEWMGIRVKWAEYLEGLKNILHGAHAEVNIHA
jgi:hypothetical protein